MSGRQVLGNMAPPQLFINTKTLGLEKQPENDKEDVDEDFEPENKQEWEAEKEEKGDNTDYSDPAEDTVGSDYEIGMERSPPILSYVVVFTGLAIALLGGLAIAILAMFSFPIGMLNNKSF